MTYAKCNLDGRPIDPRDKKNLDRFAQFLSMTDEQRSDAARNDPEWRKWLGIEESHD